MERDKTGAPDTPEMWIQRSALAAADAVSAADGAAAEAAAAAFGVLHVQCVRAARGGRCLRRASHLRIAVRYGDSELRTARVPAARGEATYFGRETLRFRVGVDDVPKSLGVALVDAGGGGAARGALDVGPLLAGGLAHLDAEVRLTGDGGDCAARVCVAFDVVEGPLKAGDAVAWSGAVASRATYPVPAGAVLTVAEADGDDVLLAYAHEGGRCRVAAKRSWVARVGRRATAPAPDGRLADLADSPLRRALATAAHDPRGAASAALPGATALARRWRRGGVEAAGLDVLYALGAADGPARTAKLVANDDSLAAFDDVSSSDDGGGDGGASDGEERSPPIRFAAAVAAVRASNAPAAQADRLRLYGLYKRATAGLPGDRPPLRDVAGRAKWSAWAAVESMDVEAAAAAYVAAAEALLDLDATPPSTPPRDSTSPTPAASPGGLGISIGALAPASAKPRGRRPPPPMPALREDPAPPEPPFRVNV